MSLNLDAFSTEAVLVLVVQSWAAWLFWDFGSGIRRLGSEPLHSGAVNNGVLQVLPSANYLIR